MNRIEAFPGRAALRTQGFGPAHERRFGSLRGTMLVVASWAVLGSIAFLYVLQVGTAISAPPTSDVDLDSSWADLSRDARAVKLQVVSFSSTTLPVEEGERIRSDVAALSSRLFDLAAEPVFAGSSTVESDSKSQADSHRGALADFVGVGASTETSALITALDALIEDSERFAGLERAAAITQLEDGTVSAIRTLGTRLLTLAVTGVIAAAALVGLGVGLGRLQRSRAPSRR
jgi:hypothetical protein